MSPDAFSCTSSSRCVSKAASASRSFAGVAIGVFGNGRISTRAYETWLPELLHGSVYMLVDDNACDLVKAKHLEFQKTMVSRTLLPKSSPNRLKSTGDAPVVKIDCLETAPVPFSTVFAKVGDDWLRLPRLNRTNTLWVKASVFLQGLVAAFPSARWYFKLDESTLLFPPSLSRFLTALDAAVDSTSAHAAPLYFGNSAWPFLNWLPLSQQLSIALNLTGPQRHHRPYAAGGGGYGLNAAAMRLLLGPPPRHLTSELGNWLVEDARRPRYTKHGGDTDAIGKSGVLQAAALWHRHGGRLMPRRDKLQPIGEDGAVGLAMLLHGVQPLTCGCFYQTTPCEDGKVALNASACRRRDRAMSTPGSSKMSNATGRARGGISNRATLCEWPITMHRLSNRWAYHAWAVEARRLGLLMPGQQSRLWL